jgi:WD40 repeat protein/tRNA A-37 threonylcarbamoyl transferase component Bud32
LTGSGELRVLSSEAGDPSLSNHIDEPSASFDSIPSIAPSPAHREMSMRPVTMCPTDTVLERLLIGQVAAAEAEQLEAHVAGCSQCAAALARIPTDDPLVNALRETVSLGPDEDKTLVDALIPCLKRLRPVDPRETLAAPTSGADSNSTPLLGPAKTADELGRLGEYRILRALGAGGMGVVYRAEDPRLKRYVAVKAIRPDLVRRREIHDRFLREAQSAAKVEHENIVAVFHVGDERGVPFLVMPLLRGESLEQRLTRVGGSLPVDETLRIAREIASGLAAAHAHGLVHRDIKPSNIWIERTNEKQICRVKILDFGLARAVQGDEADASQLGHLLGTPAYMAPEQARGEAVDHRADLFSLGCVVYQMATGQRPFAGNNFVKTLLAVALVEPTAPRIGNGQLPPALSDLIMSLLAKRPEGRPASAQAVVEEIERIEASRRPKPSRRRWFLATGAAVAAAVALTFWIGSQPAPEPAKPGKVTFVYEEPDRRVTIQRVEQPAQTFDLKDGATLTLPAGDYVIRASMERPGRRLWPEHFSVKPNESAKLEFRLVGEIRRDEWASRSVWAVALSSCKDGLRALSGSDDRTLRVWNVDREKESRLIGETTGPIYCLAVSSDGRRCLSGGGGRGRPGADHSPDFSVRLWNLETGQLAQSFAGHESSITALAIAPGDKRFLSAGDDGVFYWDVASPKPIFAAKAHGQEGIYGVTISPNGRHALSAGGDKNVVLWDLDTGKPLATWTGHTDKVCGVAFAPGATTAASSSYDGSVRLWDMKTGTARELRGHHGAVHCVAYSSDGKRLLSGGADGTVRLWDAESGKEIYRFEGHKDAVRSVAFAGDGRRALSGGKDRTVRLWELPR